MPFRLPGEWETHRATWIAWPHEVLTFPHLESVQRTFAKMISRISRGETVNLLAHRRLHEHVRSHLKKTRNVVVHDVATADVWLRDTGPIFVKKNRSLTATCWRFNAWGNKYVDLLADSGLNLKIARLAGVPAEPVDFVLEGGSIDSNGAGLCLTSEECLLNKNRNPTFTKKKIESKLSAHLGFKKFLWLGQGVAGDDTDGHVDDLARFVNEKTVVYAITEDPKNPNYASLKDNEARLEGYAKKHSLTLAPIPLPRLFDSEGNPLPASYCNFYIANACVLVPIFKKKTDREARSVLKELFPDRHVVGFDCRHLVEGFGAIHCVTQQQPL